MNLTSTGRLSLLAAIFATLLTFTGSSMASPPVSTTSDPIGDGGAAPDISSVTVSSALTTVVPTAIT